MKFRKPDERLAKLEMLVEEKVSGSLAVLNRQAGESLGKIGSVFLLFGVKT